MIRKISFYLFLFLISGYFYSCQTPVPCEDANGVQANLGFYYYSSNTLNDTLIDSLVVYALTDKAIPFYDGTKIKTDSLYLTLSMISDTSVYILQFGKDGTDTLEFYYTQYTTLISHECGMVNFYNLSGIKSTHHLIDSVWIRKELVEYGNEENVKVYF